MCLNAFPLISGHSSIRHPPLHAHKGVSLQGARASGASSVLPGSWWDLSLIRRASPLQHIHSNTDPHLAFIVTWKLYLFYFHLSKIYLQGNTNISHPMWGKFWVLFAQGLWTWFAVVTNMHIFERRPHLKFSKIYLGFPCFLSLTWKMWISVMIFLIFCKVTKDKQ